MNKYRDKSDFEINKAVAEITIYGDWYLSPTDERPFTFFNYGINSSKTVELPDYCNNPADAMPIIIENKIAIAFSSNTGKWCAYAGYMMGDRGWDIYERPTICAFSGSYYRAAMICFLMMKDAENEKS